MISDHASTAKSSPTKLTTLIFYGTGEAATSLVLNGLNGFALLYYTDALGLSAGYAGLALSISLFWEAVTEPVMGHVSDRTRTRWGARYPWIISGSLLMAVTFYFLWAVPAPFRDAGIATFWYLLCLNLLLRTTLTMFIIPYIALGFEIAPAYDDRPRLQSVRWVCNMAANFAGPALAWTIFFPDTVDLAGKTIAGTSKAGNYTQMGLCFSVAVIVLTALMLWGCRHRMIDNRRSDAEQITSSDAHFISSYVAILKDHNAMRIVTCVFILVVGMVISSSVQAYLYVHLLHISGVQRTMVHSSTMVASAAGAALSPLLVSWFDKKGAIIVGCCFGLSGKAALLVGLYAFGYSSGSFGSVTLFAAFDALYWMASGIVLPIATAMIGDIGNLAGRKAGRSLDGSYSAVLSLAWRIGVSISLLLSGYLITAVGYETASGKAASAQTMSNMAEVSFIAGGTLYIFAALVVRGYALTKESFTGPSTS